MQDLNKCPKCGQLLVAHEEIVSFDGRLYCSRSCAIKDCVDNLTKLFPHLSTNAAFEMAKIRYEDESEVILAEDVLGEDLQEVQIAVTYYRTIKLPKVLSEEKMHEVAEKLWNDGTVCAEPGDCDDVRFECALVKDRNSEHDMED